MVKQNSTTKHNHDKSSEDSTAVDTQQKTRLIIKSLPTHIDDKRLRKMFEPFGEITDSAVVHTKYVFCSSSSSH
jgi:RNA recognition motif-containing protein